MRDSKVIKTRERRGMLTRGAAAHFSSPKLGSSRKKGVCPMEKAAGH